MADKKKNETIHLSGTEDLLKRDKNGQYREQLLEQLMNEAHRLKALVDKGSDPESYEQNSSMMAALLAAVDVVDQTWQKHHEKNT